MNIHVREAVHLAPKCYSTAEFHSGRLVPLLYCRVGVHVTEEKCFRVNRTEKGKMSLTGCLFCLWDSRYAFAVALTRLFLRCSINVVQICRLSVQSVRATPTLALSCSSRPTCMRYTASLQISIDGYQHLLALNWLLPCHKLL